MNRAIAVALSLVALGAAALFVVALGGCLAGVATSQQAPQDPQPSPTPANPTPAASTAKTDFDTDVAPILSANCAACHAGTGTTVGPDYLGTGPSDFYGKLVADPRMVNNTPAASLLITQGAHEGPAFTTAQGAAVLTWLTAETTERANLPNPPPALNLGARKLQQFAACMTFSDFKATGLSDLPNQNTNVGNCKTCHSIGDYVLLGGDSSANFKALSTIPYLMKFAAAELAVDGTFQDIVPTNRFADKGGESGHPAYTLSSTRKTALQKFFQDTYSKWKAGACGSPDGGT